MDYNETTSINSKLSSTLVANTIIIPTEDNNTLQPQQQDQNDEINSNKRKRSPSPTPNEVQKSKYSKQTQIENPADLEMEMQAMFSSPPHSPVPSPEAGDDTWINFFTQKDAAAKPTPVLNTQQNHETTEIDKKVSFLYKTD